MGDLTGEDLGRAGQRHQVRRKGDAGGLGFCQQQRGHVGRLVVDKTLGNAATEPA